MSTLNEDEKRAEAESLAKMTDKDLADHVCGNVRGAAILSSRGHGHCTYDEKCGLAYDECVRRGKPEVYDRGYKMASRSFGFAG